MVTLNDAEHRTHSYNKKNKKMKNKVSDFLYEDITYKIRGACLEVWKQFGGSFKESVIDNSLTVALEAKELKVNNQKRINIYFQNKKVGTYIPDKIVNDIILLEIKCRPYLTKEDEKQFWYYLKASNYKLGLLINFAPDKLEIRRRIYDKAREKENRLNFSVNQRLNQRQRNSASTI